MPARFTVGSVPYINAIPLVEAFDRMGEASPVRVVYDVPSRLPALLDSGEVDAIMVSSFDALTVPGRKIAEGVCIGSRAAVKSVRLFSKVDFEDIQTLALDASSMTSNALARILLSELFGSEPSTVPMAPDLKAMLSTSDACVLIGDAGMAANGEGLHVLDLGEAWLRLTGKPFVWAMWVGGERLTAELASCLQAAAASSVSESHDSMIDRYVRLATPKISVSQPAIREYFESVMEYRLDESMLAGLREYGVRLQAHGYPASEFPEIVSVRPVASPAAQALL